MRQIETIIQSYIDNRSVLGTAVAILQNGKVIYSGGFGTTSVAANGIPITNQTLFAYGSIAKNVCALLTMRLVEQQQLNLDAPILQYLPTLQFSNKDYGREVTLRHLLSHTSGLPAAGKDFGPRDPESLRRFVYEQIPLYKFLAKPGTVHLYSSTAMCIAGHIAEVVTGKYYDSLADELVFKPLEMNHTTFDPTVAMTYPVALPHAEGESGNVQVSHQLAYNVSGNPSGFGYTSVSDLANLAQMYLNDGRFRDNLYLHPSSVAEMQKMETSRHVEGTINPHGYSYLGYGLGFEIGSYRGEHVVGHGGMQLSYNCFFKLFPREQASVIVLTNHANDWPLWQMVTSLYDHTLNLPPPEKMSINAFRPKISLLEEKELRHFESSVVNIETADLVRFTVNNKQLILQRENKDPIVLDTIGDNQFCSPITDRYLLPVAFVNDKNGEIAHVMIGGEPYFPIELDSEFQPNPQLWKTAEGIYKDPTNNNLDELFSVRLKGEQLFIAEGEHEVPAHAITDNCFLSELGFIEFEYSPQSESKVLVLGKSVRFYPIDEDLYRTKRVIQYTDYIPYQIGQLQYSKRQAAQHELAADAKRG